MRSRSVRGRLVRPATTFLAAAVAALSGPVEAPAQPTLSALLFSGQPMVIVDTDGVPGPTANDGGFKGFSDGAALLVMSGVPGSGNTQLRALSGDFFFDVVNFNASSANLQMTAAPGVSPPIQPGQFVNVAASGGGKDFRSLTLTQQGGSIGGGQMCDSAGTTASQVTLANGMTVVVGLGFASGANQTEYLKVPMVPFQETTGNQGSQTTPYDVYVPVRNDTGRRSVTIEDAAHPGQAIASVGLSSLPPCSSLPPASTPGATTSGLAVLVLGLTAIGARLLRRPGFQRTLPGF